MSLGHVSQYMGNCRDKETSSARAPDASAIVLGASCQFIAGRGLQCLWFCRENVALHLQNFAVNIVEAQFINSLVDQDGNDTTLSKVLAASTLLSPAPGQAP